MDTISFSNIPPEKTAALQHTFLLIKSGKENGTIDEDLVRGALGAHVNQFVSDPVVVRELMEKWQKDRSFELPWEFGSWIDALMNCELAFHSVELRNDGTGELRFEQLAWPSGGLDATEEIIKAFGGTVTSNSAI